MKKVLLIHIICISLAWQVACAQDKVTLRVGYVPLLTQLPLIVAYENGRLNFVRIEFELIKYTSFTSLEAALRVGAIDAASIPVPIALSISADMQKCRWCRIIIIGAIHRGGSVLVTKTRGDLKRIRGKLIGVPGLDSAENLLLKESLATVGLRFGIDYKTIGVPFDTAIENLQAGKYHGLYIPEPFGSIAEKEEVAFVVDGQENRLAGALTSVLVIHSDFLKINTVAVEEWLASIVQSCRFIENDVNMSDGKQTAIIQSAYFGYPIAIVTDSLVQRRGGLHFDYFLPDLLEIQEFMRLSSEMKLIMKSVDWSTILIAPNFIKHIINIIENKP